MSGHRVMLRIKCEIKVKIDESYGDRNDGGKFNQGDVSINDELYIPGGPPGPEF